MIANNVQKEKGDLRAESSMNFQIFRKRCIQFIVTLYK